VSVRSTPDSGVSSARPSRGTYHSGELEIQRRMGVHEDAARLERIVSRTLSPHVASFLVEQQSAVAASVDAEGAVWASLLSGPRGFLSVVDDELVLIEPQPAPREPLRSNLLARPELGVLAMDFGARRRFRLNGRALLDGERVFLSIHQAYGNCPRYIRAREVRPAVGKAVLGEPAPELTAVQQDWIGGADCFFVASFHPEAGADASHRGGPSGFVEVRDRRTLRFSDYPGNNMFNTLGNIAAQPRVGLLFLDFETGGMLQLTGRAVLEWPPAREQGSYPMVAVHLDRVIETRGGGLFGRAIAANIEPVTPRPDRASQ
jgi:uncharacterized protein